MKRLKSFLLLLSAVVLLSLASAQAAQVSQELSKAQETLARAMSEIGLPKGDRNLLVLTNAGYGQIANQSTEALIDMAQQITGCSMGSRSPPHLAYFTRRTALVFHLQKGRGENGVF